ncbi:DUF4062 domain-containing protein [Litoreibacter arenae]|uniref:DUF4062 domain-containing protein n=1 Tax=Litoreibacter arenae DSM 19593 TaxID=1123360 RepID=S9QA49_9RHOB|nr:DUF4062 domain-containing protein [Litoreibacter arenae]EPX76897.1 hypothetical protein thalar_02615 [Litoreibacter arenae DSM 19593]
MSDKRYQVFISSTFEDLREERRAVQDTIIQMGDFPVQMESFPAADEGQFAFIKTLIDQCDYYVLVIGGRYGTPADDGLSYTHKEYRYAVSKGVPVLVIVHENPKTIAVGKSEISEEGRKKLEAFISEATEERLRTTWSSSDQLKLRVREALEHAKATKHRVGWVRGDTTASIKALEELNEVRRENEKFRAAVNQLAIEIPLPDLPDATSTIEIDFLPSSRRGGYGASVTTAGSGSISTSWMSAFPIFYGNLKWRSDEYNGDDFYWVDVEDTLTAIGSALVQEVSDQDCTGAFKISKGTYDKLSAFYIEAGLMNTEGVEPFTQLAQRLARRHLLTDPEKPPFILSRGRTTIASVTSSVDDEIPF